MTDELSIRRFRPADVPRLQELNETALRQVDAYAEGVTDGDLGKIAETYVDSGGEFLVGEVEDDDEREIVAMGALKPADPDDAFAANRLEPGEGPAAEVTRMRVDPDHQQRGYGTRMLEVLESRADELGFEVLVLDTTRRQVGARRLYEQFGYEQVGAVEWREYEVCCYRKRLSG